MIHVERVGLSSGCQVVINSYERDYISHHNSMGLTRLKVNVNNIIRMCLENIVDLHTNH